MINHFIGKSILSGKGVSASISKNVLKYIYNIQLVELIFDNFD